MNKVHHMNENKQTTSSINNNTSHGYVLSVTGTIVDVQFPHESTPDILNELHIIFPQQNNVPEKKASIEVEQQLGDGVVRCIAIENIFDITRGLSVKDTGAPITVPVGKKVLGRV